MAGDHVTAVTTEAQFDEIIKKGKPVIVDFWADWCGPCVMMSPKFHDLAAANPGLIFLSVNVDDVGDVSDKCKVEALPTFAIFNAGAEIESDRVVGANLDKLKALVEKAKTF